MNVIQQIARRVMEETNQDIVESKRQIKAQVSGDAELMRVYAEWAVDMSVEQEWRYPRALRLRSDEGEESQAQVSFVAGEAPQPSPALVSGMQAHIADTYKRLMDYEMPGGKRLSECTKAEVEQAAQRLIATGKTQVDRGEWLHRVAGLLKKRTDRVKDVLREADLRRMQKRKDRAPSAIDELLPTGALPPLSPC